MVLTRGVIQLVQYVGEITANKASCPCTIILPLMHVPSSVVGRLLIPLAGGGLGEYGLGSRYGAGGADRGSSRREGERTR